MYVDRLTRRLYSMCSGVCRVGGFYSAISGSAWAGTVLVRRLLFFCSWKSPSVSSQLGHVDDRGQRVEYILVSCKPYSSEYTMGFLTAHIFPGLCETSLRKAIIVTVYRSDTIYDTDRQLPTCYLRPQRGTLDFKHCMANKCEAYTTDIHS